MFVRKFLSSSSAIAVILLLSLSVALFGCFGGGGGSGGSNESDNSVSAPDNLNSGQLTYISEDGDNHLYNLADGTGIYTESGQSSINFTATYDYSNTGGNTSVLLVETLTAGGSPVVPSGSLNQTLTMTWSSSTEGQVAEEAADGSTHAGPFSYSP